MTKEKDWRFAKLNETAELITGKTPSRQTPGFYTTESGIPWVKIENLGQREVYETEEYLTEAGGRRGVIVPKDAVLLSTNRTIGKTGIAGRELQTNQQITSIICNEDSGILPEYLYYYLKFSEKNIQNMAYATIANRISREALGEFIIPIASISTQKEWTTVFKYVEDYLWKKEEMLQVIAEYENCQTDELYRFHLSGKPALMKELRSLTENMKETAQDLLDSLLYTFFGEIEQDKNLYFKLKNQVSEDRAGKRPEQFEKLVPEARKLLQDISFFQRELYRKLYEAEEESAVHEVLKRMKSEGPESENQNIQSAITTVEALQQIGLLKKENKKLLYDSKEEPTEENTVRDNNGNDLGIGMWSCLFPKEE
ncbi:MAG: restriction endonuclease subunit S [Lachnospiraceae bacterium]|nr:restriction endonuclease subunit S [Lachnospiraceae bacterium]